MEKNKFDPRLHALYTHFMADTSDIKALKGRGTPDLPKNRFEKIELAPDAYHCDELPLSPRTEVFVDHARSAIAYNNSPDIPFNASLNPYRGCEHGCIYCYARPTHEYLGLSAGLDFETKIFAKRDLPQLLRRELSLPGWEPQTISISGVTDCYQPIERSLQITRACLEVLAEYRNPVTIITKNALVCRDMDVLQSLHVHEACAVFVSITTLDSKLCGLLEPRTSRPQKRLEAIAKLSSGGIPVGVMIAPVIPGLTDHELLSIVQAAAEAGARFAGYVPLRLPFGVKDLFESWLGRHYPDRQKKVLNHVRSLRGGNLNDPRFGSRMAGEGAFSKQLAQLFRLACKRAGLVNDGPHLSTASFRRRHVTQMELF